MDGQERAAIAHGTGATVARVTRTVADTHVAVLGIVRDSLAPLGHSASVPLAAAELAARANYATVQAAARVVARVARPVASASAGPDAVAASTRPSAVAWLAGLAGAFGDHMVADEHLRPLAGPMSLRSCGEEVPLDGLGSLRDARATIVVFVHGLCSHESMWAPEYLVAARESAATPLTVRYPTGQAITDSGAELARLLGQVLPAWPVALERIVLVGHSMGGLVIREALAVGGRWRGLVTDVITLGTPHTGAPLERGARRALALASAHPLAAPIAALGDERSVGIKDLAHSDVAAPVQDVAWHLVAGELAAPPLAGRIGDGMVSVSSAFAVPDGAVARRVRIPGAGHLALLGHPTGADLIRGVVGAL